MTTGRPSPGAARRPLPARAGEVFLFVALLALPALAQDLPFRRTVAQTNGAITTCVTWSTRELTWSMDTAGSAKTPGDTEFTAVDAAFATWQAVSDSCSDFKFVRGARILGVDVGRNTEGSNALVFREVACRDVVPGADPCLADGSCANKHKCWDHSDATIGLTTATYSTRTGIIYDADIEFNASPHFDGTSFLFTTISSPPCAPGNESPSCAAYDVQNTATHEIGHVVGLDHVDTPTSTMAATAPLGEVSKRIIDLGTAEGFCKTYPRGQPPVPCDELASLRRRINAQNTGTFGCTCADATGLAPWLPLALLMAALRRRRG